MLSPTFHLGVRGRSCLGMYAGLLTPPSCPRSLLLSTSLSALGHDGFRPSLCLRLILFRRFLAPADLGTGHASTVGNPTGADGSLLRASPLFESSRAGGSAGSIIISLLFLLFFSLKGIRRLIWHSFISNALIFFAFILLIGISARMANSLS